MVTRRGALALNRKIGTSVGSRVIGSYAWVARNVFVRTDPFSSRYTPISQGLPQATHLATNLESPMEEQDKEESGGDRTTGA